MRLLLVRGPVGRALVDQGAEGDYRFVTAALGPGAEPTSGLARALLALHIVFLFSLFRNALPHLPSSGFLEMLFLMTHRLDTSCLGKRGGRNLRMCEVCSTPHPAPLPVCR